MLQPITEPNVPAAPTLDQICAIVVSYNAGALIHRCVESVKAQVGKVLIVDNGSDAITRQELHTYAGSDTVELILNENNEGIAHAFNQGVRWARDRGFPWILTLDHDSEATPDMLPTMLRTLEDLKQSGIDNIGLLGANPYDRTLERLQYPLSPDKKCSALEVEDAISSGSLIPLSMFELAGMFNESLFLYYVDTDFCIRVTRMGYRIFVCGEAIMHHREGNKELRRFLRFYIYYDNYSGPARYFLTRNTVYALTKLVLSPKHIYWIVRRTLADHLMILLFDHERISKFQHSFRGLLDGLRGKYGPMEPIDRHAPPA
jgi:Predicted glycosyltransferases